MPKRKKGLGLLILALATVGLGFMAYQAVETEQGTYTVATEDSFVEAIAPDAQVVADHYGLYASVMIAQALLESERGTSRLSQAPHYNLFGIKGTYQGEGVTFLTNEDDGSGDMYEIRDQFRSYPSYYASLTDYALVLSQPMYAGTWKANTTSYQDATLALTGTYATDSSYNVKLNRLIEQYNLTQYDY
ncbi:glucosaminidase domain-containing protein [Streptococcus sp. NLN64]|uniref:glucosaminidase domain-containing protein n=1 Tax=Streptococcus sp. NLN64 TaxID=2822799 RepID=UPI0018C94A58|nr:glucosaminidase domain-containing protein [Streptococcus sp. NLN64]MBG9368091.1 glucosaminidase domain-containing protein [Streptococcus sp. NLN64]